MQKSGPIQVMLVDDHTVVRAGFRMLLAVADGIEVIAEAGRGEAVFQLYRQQPPDVVVMDLSMPGIGGLETIRRVVGRHPQAKILVFSIHDEGAYVQRAMAAGAKGYITKNAAPNVLVEAILAIAGGGSYIENGLLKSPVAIRPEAKCQVLAASLTPREFDVFILLAKGLTVQKAADELCLGYKTVANYATQIKQKLDISTLAELAQVARVSGVVKD